LEVEFRNPDVKIGDVFLAEVVNYFLDDSQFLIEDVFFERAGSERLDGRRDNLVFFTDQGLKLVQLQHNLSQVLGVPFHVFVVFVPEGFETFFDAMHHCPLLLGHQLEHLLVYLSRHLVVGVDRLLERNHEGVEID
jgi:hypothetical protein